MCYKLCFIHLLMYLIPTINSLAEFNQYVDPLENFLSSVVNSYASNRHADYAGQPYYKGYPQATSESKSYAIHDPSYQLFTPESAQYPSHGYLITAPQQHSSGVEQRGAIALDPGMVAHSPMSAAARMGYGFPQHSSGYHMPSGYGHSMSYGHMDQGYPQPSYHQSQPDHKPKTHGYEMKHMDGYGKPKQKKVYVPIVIKKKKKKKKKTIAIYKGFYIEGGTQIFGKFKKIKDCQKACEITPTCFAADYNPWLKKCYIHTNITACEEMRTHPKLIHFKKVPCDLLETPRGLITLGAQVFGGLEQKGVKSLQDCIKKCAQAGGGISPNHVETNIAKQICFGIDYDFGSHKCYFLTDEALCPELVPTIPTPVQLVEAPAVINILLCPISSVTAV